MGRKAGRRGRNQADRSAVFKWLSDLPSADQKRAVRLILREAKKMKIPSGEISISFKSRFHGNVRTVGRLDPPDRLSCPKQGETILSFRQKDDFLLRQQAWANAT